MQVFSASVYEWVHAYVCLRVCVCVCVCVYERVCVFLFLFAIFLYLIFPLLAAIGFYWLLLAAILSFFLLSRWSFERRSRREVEEEEEKKWNQRFSSPFLSCRLILINWVWCLIDGPIHLIPPSPSLTPTPPYLHLLIFGYFDIPMGWWLFG